MTVSFVGAGNISGVSGGTSRVIPYPTASTGDVAFLMVAYGGGYEPTTLSESGWNLVDAVGNAAWGSNQEVYWRRLPSAVTNSNFVTVSYSSGRDILGRIVVFSGLAATGAPFHSDALAFSGGSSSSHTATLASSSYAAGAGNFIAFSALGSSGSASASYSWSNISGGSAAYSVGTSGISLDVSAGWYLGGTSTTSPVTAQWFSITSGPSSMIIADLTPATASTTPVSQSFATSYGVEQTISQSLDVSYAVYDLASDPTPGDIVYHRRSGIYSTSSSGTFSVFWPDTGDVTPLKAGDIVFALAIANASVTFPGDWTLVGTSGVYSGTQTASLYWKRLTGAVSGSISVTGGNATAVQMFSFRGDRISGDPYDNVVIGVQAGSSTTSTAQLTGFSRNNPFLVAFGARTATSTINDTLSFTGATGGTDTDIVRTAVNSNVAAAPLAWYRKPTSATDPTAILTYGSTTGNPNSAIFALALMATSTVSTSLTTTYDTKKTVSQSLSTTYNVKQTVTKPGVSETWNVESQVSPAKSVPASWNVAQTVSKSAATSWGVAGQVAKSAPASWNVRTGVSRSVATSWDAKISAAQSLSSSWTVLPFSTPFIWGFQGPSTLADDVEQGTSPLGQTFAAPVRFNKVEAFLATFGSPSRTANFTLYNAATGGSVVASGSATFGDNSWAGITFTSLPAGTYRLEIRNSTLTASGQIAWWTNASDLFAYGHGTASSGSPDTGGDRLFRITGATAPVNTSTPTSWGVVGRITQSFTTTYNVNGLVGQVSQSFATSFDVKQTVSKSAAESWNVTSAVSATKSATWNVLNPVSKSLATTYGVKAQVTQSLAEAWQTRSAVTQSRATTWNAYIPVSKTYSTTWFTDGLKVVVPFDASWNVIQTVSRSTPASWNVYKPVTKPASSWTWQVLNSASTSKAWTYVVRQLAQQTLNQTFKVRAQTSSSTTATWNVFTPISRSVLPGSWQVFNPASTAKSFSYDLYQLTQRTLSPTWNTRIAVAPVTKTWTWQSLQAATHTFGSFDWRLKRTVVVPTDVRWHVRAPTTGVVSVVVEVPTQRVTADGFVTRMYAEVPTTRASIELSAGSRAVPVPASE